MPRVSIQGTDKVFEVNEGEVLYDALFERGTILPHGCLSGSCGACKVQIIEGKEGLQAPGAVEKNTIEAVKDDFVKERGPDFLEGKEIRLSCRAKVIGDIVFEPVK